MDFLLNLIPTLLILTACGVLAYFVYNMVKAHLTAQQNAQNYTAQTQRQQATLHLRLQAYERLMLLCDRISIPNLIARLRTEGASAQDLRFAMLIAIKQEFEHNTTQQIYVSDSLWKILQTARDNTADIINVVSQKVDTQADAGVFVAELMQFLSEKGDATAMAQAAIKQEATVLM
jgi:3-methyladenine DNA glycosylase AlkC